MFETTTCSALAWLLMAAASYRHRGDADVRGEREVRLLRTAGWAVLVAALIRCGTDLTGERVVRLLAGGSLGGVTVVMTLSLWPRVAFAPVRLMLRGLRQRLAPSAQQRPPLPLAR